MGPWQYVLIAVICLIVGGLAGLLISQKVKTTLLNKKEIELNKLLDEKKSEADVIIASAREKEELTIKDAKVQAKLIYIEAKEKADKEIEIYKQEQKESETKLLLREQLIEKRETNIEKKEDYLQKKEEVLEEKNQSYNQKVQKLKETEDIITKKEATIDNELQRVAELSRADAKKELIETFKTKLDSDYGSLVKQYEENLQRRCVELSQDILASTIDKYAQDVVSERTITVVPLPDDSIKAKIIGREGRNIKTIESKIGVDLIIDDTPEVIQISCHDPVRREIGRLTLEMLIKDGRIQPGRIEEFVAKATAEVAEITRNAGEEIIFKLGITKINRELVSTLGKLKFRTSLGQNALLHSYEVATFAGLMASELGLDVNMAKRAGLLHDIGKALDHEQEGTHVELGSRLAKKLGESAIVINAIEAHHGDVPFDNPISVLVSAADTLSAARPGARNENMEKYIQKIEALETISKSYEGVSEAYAIQAGREVRVIVNPDQADDDKIFYIAKQIKDRIENELNYPGQVKVTVIREKRAQEVAK
jgi:ribonuclease Y